MLEDGVLITSPLPGTALDAAPERPAVYSWREQGVPDPIAWGVPRILKLHGDDDLL